MTIYSSKTIIRKKEVKISIDGCNPQDCTISIIEKEKSPTPVMIRGEVVGYTKGSGDKYWDIQINIPIPKDNHSYVIYLPDFKYYFTGFGTTDQLISKDLTIESY